VKPERCDHCAAKRPLTRLVVAYRTEPSHSRVFWLCTGCKETPSSTWRRRFIEVPTKGKFQTRHATGSEGPTRRDSSRDAATPGREHFRQGSSHD